MLLALSSNQKLGIALAAGAFVVFALVSSMLIPRYRPDFPARHLGWFVTLCVLFTVGMLATVIFVARETGEEEAAAETNTTTQPTTTQTTTTTSNMPKGDPASGKRLFTAQGCNSCHTFTPAGASGQVGPNLDNIAADAQTAKAASVEEYAFTSIDDPNVYVAPGFQPGIMPDFGKTLKEQQIADLVAFITQGS